MPSSPPRISSRLGDDHQVVAKLTADNLMFLMSLKKTQGDLQECEQERDQLRLEVEQQRGPWFDQVRAGVEERVKKAMQRADHLEAELESTLARHKVENEALIAQRSDLEEYLGALKSSHEAIEMRLAEAEGARVEAEVKAGRASDGEGEARRLAEGLLADKRVLQETLAAMRLECTERWVSACLPTCPAPFLPSLILPPLDYIISYPT
jgi:chromosome segregation ATPase